MATSALPHLRKKGLPSKSRWKIKGIHWVFVKVSEENLAGSFLNTSNNAIHFQVGKEVLPIFEQYAKKVSA